MMELYCTETVSSFFFFLLNNKKVDCQSTTDVNGVNFCLYVSMVTIIFTEQDLGKESHLSILSINFTEAFSSNCLYYIEMFVHL
jgi:hypothetical protein